MEQLNISQVDTIFANGSYPIEFLIYYKNRLDGTKIRTSLKKLSRDFWPVFGRYDNGQILFDKYHEDEYFDEEARDQLFDLEQKNEDLYKAFRDIILRDLKRLIFLKVIQFKNGSVLIAKMNHLAGDGYSYFYFLSVLAQLTQNGILPFKNWLIRFLAKPKHNRTILKEFRLPDIKLNPPIAAADVKIHDQKVLKAEVKNLIRQISVKLNQAVSTNDILSAMVVKKLAELLPDKKKFQLSIPVDVRRYIKEYGAKFFGNGLMFNRIDFENNEIHASDIQSIAIEIRRGMPEISIDTYKSYLTTLEAMINKKQTEKLVPYDPQSGCLVTNLSRLPVNRLNFGGGNPDFIFPLTIGKNAASILSYKDNFILRIVC
ncbi:MAG: acyltransferase [Calditrichaceae bacterium]